MSTGRADAGLPFGLPLVGAPLDVVKVAAGLLMLGDHINAALLDYSQPLLWRFGRIAFPLFCFVGACHAIRGADPLRYLVVLLVAAIVTQPIFAMAFQNQFGSILFTLAAGTALAIWMERLPAWMPHILFALGVGVALGAPLPARTGVDFGLAGMLLPAAMVLALSRRGLYLLWLLALLFTINAVAARPADEAWWLGPLLDGLFATVGSAAVIGLASLFEHRRRFLPRYALHAFYPGHLAVLAAVRAGL